MAALSGQVTVAAAGTAVQMTAVEGHEFLLVALAGNTNAIWVGNDGAGDVTNANGFQLAPGAQATIVGELGAYWVDADTNGNKVCWLRVK